MADELQTSINYTLQHLHANHVDQLLLGLLSHLHGVSCNSRLEKLMVVLASNYQALR